MSFRFLHSGAELYKYRLFEIGIAEDLLEPIFEFLPDKALLDLRLVCRDFNNDFAAPCNVCWQRRGRKRGIVLSDGDLDRLTILWQRRCLDSGTEQPSDEAYISGAYCLACFIDEALRVTIKQLYSKYLMGFAKLPLAEAKARLYKYLELKDISSNDFEEFPSIRDCNYWIRHGKNHSRHSCHLTFLLHLSIFLDAFLRVWATYGPLDLYTNQRYYRGFKSLIKCYKLRSSLLLSKILFMLKQSNEEAYSVIVSNLDCTIILEAHKKIQYMEDMMREDEGNEFVYSVFTS